jgi:predicted MPP superfamily phosphohydrolase
VTHGYFDYIVLVIFVIVQWHITRGALRWSAARWSGARLAAARAAIVGANFVLLFGCLLSFSWLFHWLRIPGRPDVYVEAVALSYLLCATGALTLRAIIRFAGGRWNRQADPGRRRVLELAGKAAVAAPVAVLGYGTFIERFDLRVREEDIAFPQLPADLDGVRIVQISDIHRGHFFSDGDLARAVGAANEARPHVALVTGDLISAYGDPLDSCIARLGGLKADAGVYGCMGNHERAAAAEDYTEEASARGGIAFLRGRAQTLRFGSATLSLAGVDYQRRDEPYLAGAERLIEPGAFNVLLSHNPDVFPVAARQGYNLLLAGHTHGGQVTVEILDASINPARFFTPYVYGLYRRGAAAAYVTRGLGTIGMPARIGAPPEIAIVRLRRA